MKLMMRWAVVCACGACMGAGTASTVQAQQEPPPQYQQVISANPFGLLLEWFNAEYERVLGQSTTAGLGGSYHSTDNWRYLNADVFYRYYPQGRALEGWAFGVKAGITSVREDFDDGGTPGDDGTLFGFGFDVNRSWLLGANDNFYVGVGFGLKRLLGAEEGQLDYLPTIRIVNIGFAF
jgi:hypothetical protein